METNTELILILAGIIVAVLLQASVLLGILLAMRKVVQTAKEEADEYRAKLTPIIETGTKFMTVGMALATSTESLIKNLTPRLEAAAADLEIMSREIHAQVDAMRASVDEVAQKARHQADRVDGMATSFLNGVDRFGTFLNDAVHVPIRQVNGVVAAARAVMDTLRSSGPPRRPRPEPTPRPTHLDEDKDLFV